MTDLDRQLQDYRLTTAHIYYFRPDFETLLQEYIWQELDVAPKYPVLRKFLNFWQANLDGKLHSVRVASLELIKPADIKVADALIVH